MTDSAKLVEAIKRSGLKIGFIASELGLSSTGFRNKMEGRSDFTVPEMLKLSALLNLKASQRNEIFFAKNVDEMSTRA